jgi:hypothetical protein
MYINALVCLFFVYFGLFGFPESFHRAKVALEARCFRWSDLDRSMGVPGIAVVDDMGSFVVVDKFVSARLQQL